MSYIGFESIGCDQIIPEKSIRDNILVGEVFQEDRYQEIIELLEIKIDVYPGKDLFEMSENGGNLDQWDRKMILFARFLYPQRDIYIINYYF